MTAPRRRDRFRRSAPSVHRPLVAAPDSPSEVLERDPANVSRETLGGPMGLVAGGVPAEDPPPLRKEQVARLEALTAVWHRQTRVGGPQADDTLLYPPTAVPPPPRPVFGSERFAAPAPAVPAAPADPVREYLEAADAAAAGRHADTESPTAGPVTPGPSSDTNPARVSDWSSRHDPRSLEYAVRDRLTRPAPLQDVSLDTGPVLDQGTAPPLELREASACVGMACAAAANVLRARAGDLGGELLEDAARELYLTAQRRDHVHGEDYPGTSVLGGMLAGRDAGLWDTFLWALGGTRDIAQVLLQLRLAVVVGIPWSSAMEDPDPAGVIAPGGEDRGGHAVAVVGLRMSLPARGPGPWFELQQSRGVTEGVAGHVYLHHKHLAQLLAGRGEAAVPLPREGL